MNNSGQAVLTEYVMIFFVVIAALVAMSTFVQRGFQARLHEAGDSGVDTLSKSMAVSCPECLNAAGVSGNQIPYEYEPYYSQVLSDIQQNHLDNSTLTPVSAGSAGEVYSKSINEKTRTSLTSNQLPSECADGANPKPEYCSNF